jgi:hypothetical protein
LCCVVGGGGGYLLRLRLCTVLLSSRSFCHATTRYSDTKSSNLACVFSLSLLYPRLLTHSPLYHVVGPTKMRSLPDEHHLRLNLFINTRLLDKLLLCHNRVIAEITLKATYFFLDLKPVGGGRLRFIPTSPIVFVRASGFAWVDG